MDNLVIVFLAIIALYILMFYLPIALYFSAKLSGVNISLIQLMLMRFRKVPPALIVKCLIEANKANLKLERSYLEAHFLAGGNVENVTHALIIYKLKGNERSLYELSSQELKGVDVLTEAQKS